MKGTRSHGLEQSICDKIEWFPAPTTHFCGPLQVFKFDILNKKISRGDNTTKLFTYDEKLTNPQPYYIVSFFWVIVVKIIWMVHTKLKTDWNVLTGLENSKVANNSRGTYRSSLFILCHIPFYFSSSSSSSSSSSFFFCQPLLLLLNLAIKTF